MGWLQEEVEAAIDAVLDRIADGVLGFAEKIFKALLRPIVGVPTPTSDSSYIVVGTPSNEPWRSIYQDFYIQYILPLTIMLLVIALAFIGVRAGSISDYRRKRLLRRIGIVFMGTFVWFPLVSIPLQFTNAIGLTLAPLDQMSSGFGGITKGLLGGLFGLLLMVVVENVILLLAAFVYGLRWLGIIVLTALIPLLGVLWTLDVWPLNALSNIARRGASIYPGLVFAGVPAAVTFRLGWQIDQANNLSEVFALFVSLALIPAACLASLLTVYWSAPTIQRVARVGARPAARATPSTAAAKARVGRPVRGARNVHRGYSANAHGAVTKEGQSTLGSGGSRAYAIGSSTRSLTDRAGQYNARPKSSSGRVRDLARDDATKAANATKVRSKRAFRKTRRKVSRW